MAFVVWASTGSATAVVAASTGSATVLVVASTGSATAVVVASTSSATAVVVAEPVEAQTTKANKHSLGGGTGYKPAPAKGHNAGKGARKGCPYNIFRQTRRGAPACAPFPAKRQHR
ncbi:MAG: hypothetical protein LBI96_02060 [Odoribacteraceae bacterium]|nr:hypothetical protein [Odoribacteraceae bacterium]